MNKDLGFAGAALALAVVYYLMADAIPSSLLADGVGPGGMPKAYAVVLGGLSLILLARALVRRAIVRAEGPGVRREGDDGTVLRVPRIQLIRVGGMLAIGAVYVAVVPWLGYILTLAVLIAATAYYQGGTVTRQLAMVALGGALFFWLLFVIVLSIPQPRGLWPDVL